MKKITSRTNPIIKDICALHAKKGRSEQGNFIAEGVRTIQTILSGSIELVQLYIVEHLPIDTAFPKDRITLVSHEVMEKISTTKAPSGYLAVCKIPKKPHAKLESGLVLARIADPGNMGTLIRTAAALAAPTVVIVEGADPWSPKVVNATAGTIGLVKIYEYSWHELLQKKSAITLCALVVKNGTPANKLKHKDALLVVGNEAHGIPSDWINDCDAAITIPMPGETESLNAAVAGSIALYLMQQDNAQLATTQTLQYHQE